MLVKQ